MGAINDIYLLTVKGSNAGQDILHTLHFKSAVVGTDTAIQQDLIDSWQASSQAAFLAATTADYTLNEIWAQRVCGTLPLPAATVETVNAVGTGAASSATEALPPWYAALVRLKTGFAGREYQGRFFYPVLYRGWTNGRNLSATFIGLLDTYRTSLNSYLSGGADADWDLFVRSRKLAAVPGVQCQNTGAVVVSTSTSQFATTMRSRRSRTGS